MSAADIVTQTSLQSLCDAVDAASMMRHLEEFSRRVKLSGTPEELESFQYLQTTLDGYGYQTNLVQHDAYISLPGRARIEIGAKTPECITHSFSRSSPIGGLHGKVVYAGHGGAEDFAGLDVAGRVVLLESIANPAASLRASRAGAVGQIHISPHQHLHDMCISSVWGSPTEETLVQLPRTVVLSVRKADGDALKQRVLAGEEVEAVLHAEVDTGWRTTPLLVAELPGPTPDGPFVMFSGHHDTWYYGVMDNGGANATMLEVARLLAHEQAAWQRGLRLCFWSGHSHGRYSGSAWYADNHWEELAQRCVAHVNVDSTGARGNTVMSDAVASAELAGLAAEAVWEQGQQQLTGLRPSRAGDQSFWGIGVPSLFMGMGEQAADTGDNVMGAVMGGGNRKGAGFGWWWHTPDDTLDKMDPELLVRDTRVYVHAIWRLLTARVLPLDYAAAMAALQDQLSKLAAALQGRMDLSPLASRVASLSELAKAVSLRVPTVRDDAEAGQINKSLVAVSRALVPMDYTTGDRFDHDPALGQAPYPVLDPVRRLAAALARADESRFLAVAARRSCNRLTFALDQAMAALQGCQSSL
jgi:N-acetylated-alpha-linked acidic dipeptidase